MSALVRMPAAVVSLRASSLIGGMLLMACMLPAVDAWAVSPLTTKQVDARAMQPKAETATASQNPEQLLIAVYQELAANRLREALAKADALVAAYPTFHLGHLIRGDLLLMHARPVTTLGAASGGDPEKLKNLRAEAAVRLNALRERPDPKLVPRAVMQMRDDQKHVLLMDASRSRLYVYENKGGQPHYVTEYYVSQGKLGINKLKEGDQKTPIGVYYITSRLPGPRLPDFYGPGALPINYPNEWDKIHGRSGSGIWLHGTPSNSYSRPPLSSDGCVVLTNPDLRELSDIVEVGKTPVLISDRLEYVSKTKWNAERTAAAQLLDNWRGALESGDAARLRKHYSSRFKSDQGEALDTWLGRQRLSGNQGDTGDATRKLNVALSDTSLFQYPGPEPLMVATFTQDITTGKNRRSLRKRQYWSRETTGWKIIAETNWPGNS